MNRSVSASLLLWAVFTQAQASPDLAKAAELAKASGCYSCHANEDKVVGPSFKAIAIKYAADTDAATSLAQSIQNGSRGKWGRIPMPPHSSLSVDDLRTLSTLVLSFKD